MRIHRKLQTTVPSWVTLVALVTLVPACSSNSKGPPDGPAEAGTPVEAGPSMEAGTPEDGGVADATSPAALTVQMVVGASGGTLQLNGATLDIPPGALSSDQTIMIRSVAADPSLGAHSFFYSFEPHGLTFAVPATVTIPFTDGANMGSIFWSTDATNVAYSALPTTDDASSATAQIDHFSFSFIGTESPQGDLLICSVVSNDGEGGLANDTCPPMYRLGTEGIAIICGWVGSAPQYGKGWECAPIADGGLDGGGEEGTPPPPPPPPTLDSGTDEDADADVCDPSTCSSGCCESPTQCAPGNTDLACGTGGGACSVCNGDSGTKCGDSQTCVFCGALGATCCTSGTFCGMALDGCKEEVSLGCGSNVCCYPSGTQSVPANECCSGTTHVGTSTCNEGNVPICD